MLITVHSPHCVWIHAVVEGSSDLVCSTFVLMMGAIIILYTYSYDVSTIS